MNRWWPCAAASLLLVGCAPAPAWDRPGAGDEEIALDSDACWHATPKNGYFASGIGASPTLAVKMQDAYDKCMLGKGYARRSTN